MGKVIGVPGLNFTHFRQSNTQEKLEDGRGIWRRLMPAAHKFWQDRRDLVRANCYQM